MESMQEETHIPSNKSVLSVSVEKIEFAFPLQHYYYYYYY
jgi:hypothetical protein